VEIVGQSTGAPAPNGPGSTSLLDEGERGELEALLARLIATPSINPWINPEGTGEGSVAQLIADWLSAVPGVEVQMVEAQDGRPNVLARVSSGKEGKRLCVHVHTDTVDCAAWQQTAFTARREGDRLIGLGAADNKAQCAALMLAVRRLAEGSRPASGELLAAFVIDEEGPSVGTHELVKTLRADAAIVLEPVGNARCVVTHQGFGSMDLVVRARAAHGMDDGAPDAIVHLAELIRGMVEIDRGLAAKPHRLNGKSFFHTGFVSGGTDYGTYPREVTLGFEMGTQPGETLQTRVDEVQAVIETVRRSTYPELDAEIVVRLDNSPFEAQGHEQILAVYKAATLAVCGRELVEVGLNSWADSAITQQAGIPTILCGALGGNAHAIDEWTSLSEVAELVAILQDSCIAFCDR
jgi:acetylornithine deacetylase/succinyl-diaminopimelate desuccinylase-like protein